MAEEAETAEMVSYFIQGKSGEEGETGGWGLCPF